LGDMSDLYGFAQVDPVLCRPAADCANVLCIFRQHSDGPHVPKAYNMTKMFFVVRMKISQLKVQLLNFLLTHIPPFLFVGESIGTPSKTNT
jgi:hypothetical protein